MTRAISINHTNGLEDYIEGNPIWYVKLSNGDTVYQDDCFREGYEKSWQLLKRHCLYHRLNIVSMVIGFRSNKYSLPENKKGYYFSKAVRANPLYCHGMFVVGYLDDDGILVKQKWKVPEMVLDSELEYVSLTEIEKENNECLILNNTTQSMVPA